MGTDLIEKDGRYFISFTLEGRLFIVHADNPRDRWSAPINFEPRWHLSRHVAWPDGKLYLYSSGGHAIELSADGLSRVAQSKKIYNG